MIILIIHQNGILTFKPKSQTPVSIDLDGPVTSQLALQRVQIPSGEVHAVRASGAIQNCQLIFEFDCMSRVDACF